MLGNNGFNKEETRYSMPLVIVYYGVPLPGKSNPYIVLRSKDPSLVSIAVGIDEAEKASSVKTSGVSLGWRYELAIKSFVDEVSARLEQPLHVVLDISVKGVSFPPASSIYAAASLAIVRAVSELGGYELAVDEVLQAANDIDRESGVGLDYLEAMRAAIIRGKSLIYRRGEEPVDLPSNREIILELVGEEDIGDDITGRLEDPIYSEITRLLGLNVIEVAAKLRENSQDNVETDLSIYERIENAAYYMLYGAGIPDPGCKWTPSLQRVYGVCRPGTKLGDEVVFLL